MYSIWIKSVFMTVDARLLFVYVSFNLEFFLVNMVCTALVSTLFFFYFILRSMAWVNDFIYQLIIWFPCVLLSLSMKYVVAAWVIFAMFRHSMFACQRNMFVIREMHGYFCPMKGITNNSKSTAREELLSLMCGNLDFSFFPCILH